MINYNTKYFGEIIIDESRDCNNLSVIYEDSRIDFFLELGNKSECYYAKIDKFFSIIDRYIELDKICKEKIVENYNNNAIINNYFKKNFDVLLKEQLIEIFGVDNFENFDIEKAIKRLKNTRISFDCSDYEIITKTQLYPYVALFSETKKMDKNNFVLNYMIAEKYSNEILAIKIDYEFNIIDFYNDELVK
jgi:hypothetical protein